MPRRKPRSPLEEATAAHDAAMEKLIAAYRGSFLKAMDGAMEAIDEAYRVPGDLERLKREAKKATDRAYREAIDRGFDPESVPLDDEEKVEQQWWLAGVIQRVVDMHAGARQRASGSKGKGVPRERYAGKPIPPAAELRAAVQARHAQDPTLSFNQVCSEVARKYGKADYAASAWSVKRVAKSIQWSRCRRK